MDSLQTLIDRWHDMVINGALDDEIVEARRALELRLVELTGHLEGMCMAGVSLGRPLLLLKGDQPS